MKKFYNSKLLFVALLGFLFKVNILFANQVDVTFENGDRYIGEVLNNKKHGSGTYIEAGPDGKEYKGEWKNDKQHGKGFLKQNDIEYTGDFFEGKIQGKGVLVDKDGKYEGEFLNGMMHGNGVLKLNDGRIVRGEFKNNKYVGAPKKVVNQSTKMSSNSQEIEEKENLEYQKKVDLEKKKKLEAKKKEEKERQKKLEAQRAAKQLDAKISLENETALNILEKEIAFNESQAGKNRKIEIFEAINNTPLDYCESFTYKDLLNDVKEDLTASDVYQSKFRLIRDILIHNAYFMGIDKWHNEDGAEIGAWQFRSQITELIVSKKLEGMDMPMIIREFYFSESKKYKDTQYFWLSGNYNFDQPNDVKLSMLNNAKVDILFKKNDANSDWKICDMECLVGSDMFLQVDLDNEHKTLFLSDLNLRKSGGWRSTRSLKVLKINSLFSENVSQFRPPWINSDNPSLFDFIVKSSSLAYDQQYVLHQDWLVHVALAQSLSYRNPDFFNCWDNHKAALAGEQ